jgi:sigma-B regulation protein RsbU (phosphoserine phosphatase)
MESKEINLPLIEETNTIASKEIKHFNQSRKRTEHLEKGLDSASECIRKILPQHAPTLPNYEAGFLYEPSDKVGGDFFDFIRLEDDTLGITIGDVSGHGIDSAIVMGMAKKVIRLRAKADPHGSPATILSQVNEDLFEDLGRNTFITALYANISLKDGKVKFARAGHEPPFRFKLDQVVPVSYEQSKGIALGMEPGPVFNKIIEEKSIVLSPGEGLLFYTDGIVESTNPRRDLFTRERLGYVLEQVSGVLNAESLIAKLQGEIDEFCEGVPPEDDMTAIAVLRR